MLPVIKTIFNVCLGLRMREKVNWFRDAKHA